MQGQAGFLKFSQESLFPNPRVIYIVKSAFRLNQSDYAMMT